jgi:hypothetical protein
MRQVAIKKLALLAFAAVAWSSEATAQSAVESTPALVVGDTIKVWAPVPRLDGVMALFQRLDAREIVISGTSQNPSMPARHVAVPLNSSLKVEVLRRRERSRRRLMTGIAVGAAAGALLGAPLGPLIECGGVCDKVGDRTPMVGWGLGAAIGAPIGALLGGVIGGTTRARWQEVTFTVR